MLILDTLNTDMRTAMKNRDIITMKTLKVLLAHIANAEAVEVHGNPETTEVPRKQLSKDDIYAIIDHEIEELNQALSHFKDENNSYSSDLRQSIIVLEKYKKRHI